MNATKGDWTRVAELVAERFTELAVSKSRFSELTGLSAHTLNAVLEGRPIQRADKRGDLAAGLGWTRDSIDRILEGGEPVSLTDAKPAKLDEIDERLERIEGLLGRLLDGRPSEHR